MNWEAIGAVGEIIGAMAVVLSLIYLAIQVRQNSNMARAESRLRVVASYREFSNALKGKDPTAFGRGLQCYPDLPVVRRKPWKIVSPEANCPIFGGFS